MKGLFELLSLVLFCLILLWFFLLSFVLVLGVLFCIDVRLFVFFCFVFVFLVLFWLVFFWFIRVLFDLLGFVLGRVVFVGVVLVDVVLVEVVFCCLVLSCKVVLLIVGLVWFKWWIFKNGLGIVFFVSLMRCLWCVKRIIWICLEIFFKIWSVVIVCGLLKFKRMLFRMNGNGFWFWFVFLSFVICKVKKSWFWVFLFILLIVIVFLFLLWILNNVGLLLLLRLIWRLWNWFSVNCVNSFFVWVRIGFWFFLWNWVMFFFSINIIVCRIVYLCVSDLIFVVIFLFLLVSFEVVVLLLRVCKVWFFWLILCSNLLCFGFSLLSICVMFFNFILIELVVSFDLMMEWIKLLSELLLEILISCFFVFDFWVSNFFFLIFCLVVIFKLILLLIESWWW